MRVSYQMRRVDVREEGRGPLVVLIHGYPLDGDMWSPVSAILSKRFRVLRPDLPARRDTPRPPEPGIGLYADWIQSVLGAANEPTGVAGFSMGGYVLFELLRRKAENIRGAAFVATRADSDTDAERLARNSAIFTAREMGPLAISERMVPRLLSPAGRRDPALTESVRAIVRRQNPNSIENDLLAMRDRPDYSAELSGIAVPVLAIAGAEDAIIGEAAMKKIADGTPNGRFVSVAGAGHLAPMEKPEDVARELGAFFGDALR
jgi:pimeloyl-ACP methyl ester carboxylesterase